MDLRELRRVAAVAVSLMLVFCFFVGASWGSDELTMLVYLDDFDDYVVKEYVGSDGPGSWYQESSPPDEGEFRIMSVDGKTVYALSMKSSFGSAESIIYYYMPVPFLGIIYLGPSNYTFSAAVKTTAIGGLIFRAQPVKVDDKYRFWKFYSATINKVHKKLFLYYRYFEEGTFKADLIAEAEIPDSIDLDDWVTMTVTAKGGSITVTIEGKVLIEANDDRLSWGSVGLYSSVLPTYFDSVSWSIHVPEEGTVTTTETVTSTYTVPGTTVTTTSPGTGATTITTTITETVTVAGSTVTTTTTETSATTELGKTTTIYSVVTRTLLSTVTKTVTTVLKQPARKVVTKTIEHTVTETKVAPSRCLIATAAFGSELAPQVQMLREFRDGFVMRTFAGENFMKAFNAFYYSWSPYVARAEYENPALRGFVRTSIYPLLFSLELSKQVAEPFSTFPELAVLVSGIAASLLIGLIYASPPMIVAFMALRWKRKGVNIRLLYPAAVFAAGLALFALAEAFISPVLMILASSTIVLSAIALGAMMPAKILSDRLLRGRSFC